MRLSDAWADGARAYMGVTTAGFPNLFMLYGPNTNNGSILLMLEHQVEHVLMQLRRMVEEDLAWIDVRADAMERYNTDVQNLLDSVEVWQAGCNTYYRTPSGRIVTQWPLSMQEFHDRTKTINPSHFLTST